MSDLTRRDFVKTTGAVAAVAATTLPAWAIQEKRYPVKIGLIGCGGRGTGAANQSLTANEDAVIWAMGDAFQDRLTSMQTRSRMSKVIAQLFQWNVDLLGSMLFNKSSTQVLTWSS